MVFNRHSNLVGQHAFLSPSKFAWVRYGEEKFAESYMNHLAVKKGTELHDFAAQCIRLGIRLPKTQETLNMYVNDAIGYKMTPEQPLQPFRNSLNAFGTADAISFRNDMLRIHDLKTGIVPAHMEQLLIYSAFFCLEYQIKPNDISTELRIYQNNEILVCSPDPEEIQSVIDQTIMGNSIIEKLSMEVD